MGLLPALWHKIGVGMSWYFWIGHMIVTIMYYAIGNEDGEKHSDSGLKLWAINNTIILVWIIATAWARR